MEGLLDLGSRTVLDIGCGDKSFSRRIGDRYDVVVGDLFSGGDGIIRADVQDLGFDDDSFDIVVCLQVLEHLPDPVKAICELARVARRQVIISVPHEPFFSLSRFFLPEREHLWTVSPKALRVHLGEPVFEARFYFWRYYVGVWSMGP